MDTSKKQFSSIDEYIASFPQEDREILEKLRQTIRETAPDAAETISYQMPTFRLHGSYLVYFAAYKNHISLYPTPAEAADFGDALTPYLAGKGTLRFPKDQPLPDALIRRVIQRRMEENLAKRDKKQGG